ncbi:hypothetical protein AB0958_41560, partial [Streptomyces sp. NPDC006655]|uniref:hypothetical protein n=1 Tax=Streptomyces sp. NPDC006655 TaxID=3156898 RepID=UPI00345243E2
MPAEQYGRRHHRLLAAQLSGLAGPKPSAAVGGEGLRACGLSRLRAAAIPCSAAFVRCSTRIRVP